MCLVFIISDVARRKQKALSPRQSQAYLGFKNHWSQHCFIWIGHFIFISNLKGREPQMISGIFCFILLFLSGIKETVATGIAKFQCANETECDSSCTKMYDKFRAEYSHGWAVRHPSIGHWYRELGCKVCVEIGVARGELAEYLLKHVPQIEEYHGVDPFLGGYDSTDAMSKILSSMNSSLVWSQAVLRVLRDHGCKFRLHYGLSTVVYKDFPPNSVDCIFIDGDHTFEGVKADIVKWSPIIKAGGYYFFDDVTHQYPGTVKAVDTFVEKNKLFIRQMNKHNNYYVQKPENTSVVLDFNW